MCTQMIKTDVCEHHFTVALPNTAINLFLIISQHTLIRS